MRVIGKFCVALGLLAVGWPGACGGQMCGGVDAVYFNGHILTGEGLQAVDGPGVKPVFVQAMATLHDKIAITGSDADVLQCAGDAKRVDLHGAFVMPGFDDAHTHTAFAGQQRLTVDLDNVRSLAAMQAKVKAYAEGLPPGAWITGGGWDHTKWVSKTLPTRQEMDAVSGGHPAYLERTDGHIGVLNTAALEACGITGKTKAPLGGAIDLDAKGEPTGIVRDTALNEVRDHIPPPDAATRRKALELSISDALSHGVTSVQDFSTIDDFRVLMAMEDEGKLPLRYAEWIPFILPMAEIREYQALRPKTDLYLHTTMLKGFMDGSLGSRTAAMEAPYSDDPGNSGLPRFDQAKLNAMAAERAAAGFQLGFHAIGDKANAMALNAFAAADEANPNKCHPPADASADYDEICSDAPSGRLRFRIEHAQVLLPGAFAEFAKLGVIASMQPSHLLTDMTWAEDRIGPERAKYAYAWKSMLDHHVRLAFGTDYPVESIDPMRGLYAATTRMNVEGTQTFHPEQRITMAEALYAYTQGSAYAEFEETIKGELEPGFLADFVVLDRDLTKTTGREILRVKVLRTVVGGVTRYTAGSNVVMGPVRKGKDDGD